MPTAHSRSKEEDICPPVLLLIFNRPELIKATLSPLRNVAPKRVYIAADGPRNSRSSDIALCKETKSLILNEIDWPCEIFTLFREKNLGCRKAVATAIDWFFTHEEAGIILEEDCKLHPSWFRFAKQLLDKYQDDKRIMSISAINFGTPFLDMEDSYYFSHYPHCWGWATWKRAWEYYDDKIQLWPALRQTNWLFAIGNNNQDFANYWSYIFDEVYNERINSWAYRWLFSSWTQHTLHITPSKNLVLNNGFSPEATHTKDKDPIIENLSLQEMEFPLSHPKTTIQNYNSDLWENKHVFHISKIQNIKFLVKKLLLKSRN